MPTGLLSPHFAPTPAAIDGCADAPFAVTSAAARSDAAPADAVPFGAAPSDTAPGPMLTTAGIPAGAIPTVAPGAASATPGVASALASDVALDVASDSARVRGLRVNDVHSRLNETSVARIVSVGSIEMLRATIQQAARHAVPISVAGSRHAMGGQQFVRDGWMLDMRPLRRVLSLDRERGLVTVEAGIEWPALIAALDRLQARDPHPWTIVQKQTGADRLTIGGALASNIHGRGLRLPPIVSNVESFVLVDADGRCRECSRTNNRTLFRTAIGGYGLMGAIATVTLRLQRRVSLVRRVEIRDAHGLVDAFARRVAEGCEFGDFQFATDSAHDAFLRTGVFSCYQRVDDDDDDRGHGNGGNRGNRGNGANGGNVANGGAGGNRGDRGNRAGGLGERSLSADDWRRLAYLAHVDKSRAFEMYARHYLSTDGQRYASDTHQLAFYEPEYHAHLDVQPGMAPGTEMITELYVPRPALDAFLDAARTFLRAQAADVIYGTIRLIERDEETLLAWAREPWACIIFNLHVTHTPAAMARAADTFRGLIDLAIAHDGSYYLTYHRWATHAQLRHCYPQFDELITLKRELDPENRFQSDWYRHYAPEP